MSRTSKDDQKWSSDEVMRKVALTLISDFQDVVQDPLFCCDHRDAIRSGDIERIRATCPAPDEKMDVASYKATYQISSVFKRYRFETDTYSDEELTTKAISSFQETQHRLATIDLDALSAIDNAILNHAACHVSFVLGTYDDVEHRSLCRFGKKASVGIPAKHACEAARWELPISGSCEQISWFDSEMSQVQCVQEYWADQIRRDPNRSVYHETSSLKLALVPKTFKALRAIMPNTTIGSYMSYGLGEMMRKRLKRTGYDIRSLQMTHRVLARSASLHGNHVTADLSSASDSISVALVERLLPPDWFRILNQSRIGNVLLPDGTSQNSLTFCTMGIGYTFPLQTLIFLSLLKGIERVYFPRASRRTISVYGDDMIYHIRQHEHVVRFFEQVGFVINLDKTYHTGNFRESCGGDYYHGVDVRPFQPRNGPASTSRRAREAILYKFINGLLMRWSEYEIGKTLRYLTSEVELCVGKCKLVPHDFPDDAGIKCSLPIRMEFLAEAKSSRPTSIGHGLFRFSYLRFTPELREEVRHGPYFWARLRGGPLQSADYDCKVTSGRGHLALSDRVGQLTGCSLEVSPLIIKEVKPIKTIRSSFSGRRLRRTSTFVTISHTGRYTRQSGFSCFGNP